MSVGEFSSSVGRIGEVIMERSYSSSASESWYVGGIAMAEGGRRTEGGADYSNGSVATSLSPVTSQLWVSRAPRH